MFTLMMKDVFVDGHMHWIWFRNWDWKMLLHSYRVWFFNYVRYLKQCQINTNFITKKCLIYISNLLEDLFFFILLMYLFLDVIRFWLLHGYFNVFNYFHRDRMWNRHRYLVRLGYRYPDLLRDRHWYRMGNRYRVFLINWNLYWFLCFRVSRAVSVIVACINCGHQGGNYLKK